MFDYLNDLIDVRRVTTIECCSMYYCLCIGHGRKIDRQKRATTRNINVYKYAIGENQDCARKRPKETSRNVRPNRDH